MTATILNVVGLTSGYGATVVLRDVSLALGEGEILAVLGKNGMGKSTLLKTIMGFLRPMSGSVELGGQGDITGQPPYLTARAGVAYAPQEYTIFQELTVEENLRLALPDDASFRARVGSLKDLFPRMIERLGQRAGTLSGGEQKMLIMSRALLAQPQIMLIDEISEGLQPTMIERMAEALRRSRDGQGVSILIVEQHLGFALSVADRYAVLKLGEIIEEGKAGDPAAAYRLADHMKV